MKYHVTPKWDGRDLETAAQRMGEVDAIEMFCEKWDCDTSFAADQVTKIFLYASLDEAKKHQDDYDGEILEINDEWLEIFEDWSEGSAVLATRSTIKADDISRL